MEAEKKLNKNIHKGHRERMREKFLKGNPESFQTHELVEMLLYYCIPLKDTNPIAHKIMNEYATLSMLFDADIKDLERRCELTEKTAFIFGLVSEMLKRSLRDKWEKRVVLNSSVLAGEYSVSLLYLEKYECFYAIMLDSQNRLINSTLISEGTVDEAPVYPRFVVAAALRYMASKVILAHNHPGGGLRPSLSDVNITDKIVNALNSIDIFVVDHIIVAEDKFSSMADLGMMKNNI